MSLLAKRRWFRFSLRTMFVVVTVGAIGTAIVLSTPATGSIAPRLIVAVTLLIWALVYFSIQRVAQALSRK